MNVGTKSILFGVHQFIWHPITVARAWRHLYGRWPSSAEGICIFFHDWGYWGCPNIDGAEGRRHPERGAKIAGIVTSWFYKLTGRGYLAHVAKLLAERFTINHSIHYAQLSGSKVSPLYAADKVSILFDPAWFYLLRSRLSGEVYEYARNSPLKNPTPGEWLRWYKRKTKVTFGL